MASKRASLSDFNAVKPGQVQPQDRPLPESAEKRKGQTLRLTPAAWRQLKILAVERGTATHALLIEAINDLFQKNGKPPIA